MSDLDPLASVTNERFGVVVGEIKNEISNLNTELTTNLNLSMKESMREMLKEFLGDPTPKVDTTPVATDSGTKPDIPPSTDLVNVDGTANATPPLVQTTKSLAPGVSSTPRSPGVYASVPPGQLYNANHQHVNPPHIANMGAPPMLDPKDFPN